MEYDPITNPIMDPRLGDVAEHLGYTLSLDLDGDLIVAPPLTIDVAKLTALIELHHQPLANLVQRRAENDRQRYHGGPLDGQRHDRFHSWPWSTPRYFGVHIQRAKWAVYQLWEDGRAIFQGYATSEKKAKVGAVNTVVSK